MSIDRESRLPELYSLTTFYGGRRGPCLQVTLRNGTYIKLSYVEADQMARDLAGFIDGLLEEKDEGVVK